MNKPLIYYTIKAVKESNIFNRFILSTDSEEIAQIGKQYGVEVPFLRPKKLAQDDSIASDAIIHALKWVEKNDKKYDFVQYIFPTSPLKTSEDLLNGVKILLKKDADMVISVCETDHPKFWMNILPENNSLKNFVSPKYREKNRQDFPKTYRINGGIYVGKWDVFYHKKDYYEQDTYAYIMPKERSIDIDSDLDFKLAQLVKAHDIR